MPPESNTLPDGLLVVIPCYNAGDRIAPVLRAVRAQTSRLIIVDDGSTDGCLSGDLAAGVRVVRHERNLGKGHAILTGMRAALEDGPVTCIAFLDADGQHDPAQLPALYAAFQQENADLLIGARVLTGKGVPLPSRAGNLATAALTRLLLPRAVSDTQSGFRLHSRAFAQHVVQTVRGGRYETEMEILLRALLGPWRVAEHAIPTLYEAGNPSSHFQKLSDSLRIYRRFYETLRRVKSEG